jgi:hypothetical protein
LTVTETDERRLKFLRASYDGNAVVDVAELNLQTGKTSLSADDERSYDSIVCFNRVATLDVGNEAALERAKNYLVPSGRLIAVLPAKQGKKEDKTQGYSKKEIREYLEKAGFNVEELTPFASVERLFLRRDPKRTSQFGFKTFDALLPYSSWMNAFIAPTRYFVVASVKK